MIKNTKLILLTGIILLIIYRLGKEKFTSADNMLLLAEGGDPTIL